MTTHIGWDIGAAAVTRLLSRHFAATAILQNYSRLVVDCNRDPAADDFIISCSDGTRIPGNQSLSEHARQQRRAALFEPYDRCISKAVMAPHVRLILSIHSFTPIMDGFQRPWDIGFLFIRDTHTSHSLAAALSAIRPELCIGFNQPYNATTTGRFIQAHGEPSGVAHALIEIRNDHIDSAQGQAQWATYLIAAIEHHLAQNG